jgi:hypothetical protein
VRRATTPTPTSGRGVRVKVRMGPEGLEPSPVWLRARGSAARALVPIGPEGVEPSSPGYRPGALPLSYRSRMAASFPCAERCRIIGPEGFEPPPPGLKGRCAAVTPRPRILVGIEGRAFDSPHPILLLLSHHMRSSSRDGRIRTGALLLPGQADSQAFPHPGGCIFPLSLSGSLSVAGQSGRPDLNRRSQAPRACGLPGFPTP